MIVNTMNENLCINKLVASKKEILMVEGDMIVPDSKPDVLNTICTSGVVCIYKKELLDERIRIDGSINAYIMYFADDVKDKIRGINTCLDFSETINVPGAKEGMMFKLENKLKSIESKVINGRKIGIKATIEINIKIYSSEDIEIINDIQNAEGIQMLKENLKVNSLLGTGENKVYVKETVAIDNIDNIAEILKINLAICDKDTKISYNKILTKAEAQVKIMYLTEDDRVNTAVSKIPIIGFIDLLNITEENICDIDYEIKNIILKPNSLEEHSIYVEIEVLITATAYEEKEINLIQDLYSPSQNLEFNKKRITTITGKKINKEIKQIREKIEIEGIQNKNIIDVDVTPTIEKEEKLNNKILYEGNVEVSFILSDEGLQMNMRNIKIPFEYIIENIEDIENFNFKIDIEVANQDFIIQDGNLVISNIDLLINNASYMNTNLNIMDEIQINGERELEDYSMIIYVVKKGDSLWNIAKEFGSTVDEIARSNGIEDPSRINPGQKLFIPRYKKVGVSSQKASMSNNV